MDASKPTNPTQWLVVTGPRIPRETAGRCDSHALRKTCNERFHAMLLTVAATSAVALNPQALWARAVQEAHRAPRAP
eukprot:6535133-Pyramimonas_sp.AAC.1